jgi:hypothetical protein
MYSVGYAGYYGLSMGECAPAQYCLALTPSRWIIHRPLRLARPPYVLSMSDNQCLRRASCGCKGSSHEGSQTRGGTQTARRGQRARRRGRCMIPAASSPQALIIRHREDVRRGKETSRLHSPSVAPGVLISVSSTKTLGPVMDAALEATLLVSAPSSYERGTLEARGFFAPPYVRSW